MLRHEGLGYFIKRVFQLLSWQVGQLIHSNRLAPAARFDERLIIIDDIQDEVAAQLDYAADDTVVSSSSSIQDLSTGAPGKDHRDRLVALGQAAFQRYLPDKQSIIEQGVQLFSDRKVLFVSPIRVLGGGANLVFLTAKAMRQMGVDAQILNINVHRQWFEKHYPHPPVPVLFTEVEEIPRVASGFDAVLATSNPTVAWIRPATKIKPQLKLGYYIQDYEPYFYQVGSHEYHRATDSYTLSPSLLRMVTTPWIAEQIKLHNHVDSTVVGSCLDTALFHPRYSSNPAWPTRPLRITAMIRPSTPRRNPHLTMAVLEQVSRIYANKVEIILFGCDFSEPGFSSLPTDFPWRLAGQLRSTQVASLFNEADIFIDLSEFQALGLTALEAMATGLAVIVPKDGGAGVYAKNGENCLVVDTHGQQACLTALQQLIEDDSLRLSLQENAVTTAVGFFPELPALNMLKALFAG
jgi:glycosyltransferase involved in cell wall biosynthesis